jgi:hypothetical protein
LFAILAGEFICQDNLVFAFAGFTSDAPSGLMSDFITFGVERCQFIHVPTLSLIFEVAIDSSSWKEATLPILRHFQLGLTFIVEATVKIYLQMVRLFLDLYKVVVLPKPRRTSRKLEKRRWKSRHERADNGLKMEFEWVVELSNVVSWFWKRNFYLKRNGRNEEEGWSMLRLI